MTKRLAWLLVAFFTLAMASCAARAGTTGVVGWDGQTGWAPVAGGGYTRVVGAYSDPVTARIWSAAGGKVVATDAVIVSARGGALAISSAAAVGVGDAALAVARCLVGGGPAICAAGSAAAAVYSGYRIYTDSQTPAGKVMKDPGQPSQSTTGACWKTVGGAYSGAAPPEQCALSGSAALVAYAAKRQAALAVVYPSAGYQCSPTTVIVSNATQHYQTIFCSQITGPSHSEDVIAQKTTETIISCPGSIDASNPAEDIPAGGPGPDGKCRTARYNHSPVSPQAAADAVAAFPPDSFPSAQWRDAVRDSLGPNSTPIPATITTTGPGSQTGTPVTTTTTTGSTTKTETKTPTYSYTYNGDTITYNTTYTTVTNNNGTITTTTEGETPASQDPDDPCVKNPLRVGCSLLGTPETTKPTWADKPITYTPESLGMAASCPAPLTFPVRGQTVSFAWTPICNAAPLVRSVLLAMTALMCAGFIVLQVSKT